jgi:hypothetical protein
MRTGFWSESPKGSDHLGTPRRRWEDDNIRIDHKEKVGGGGGINLCQDRGQWRILVNMVMNLQVL